MERCHARSEKNNNCGFIWTQWSEANEKKVILLDSTIGVGGGFVIQVIAEGVNRMLMASENEPEISLSK
jgi:hypothetical protein